MFRQMLPDCVSLSEASPWMWETPTLADEEKCLARAVNKRQREFRAGRHSARQALSALGISAGPILPGIQREPLWPAGTLGSITHTDDYCAAAVGHSTALLGIGIDAETREPLASDVVGLVLTAGEMAKLGQYADEGCNDAAKIIFSAKECIHKVYFPLNRHTLDFLEAEVTLNTGNKTFEARILARPPFCDVDIRRLSGRYDTDAFLIYTCIVLQNDVQGA